MSETLLVLLRQTLRFTSKRVVKRVLLIVAIIFLTVTGLPVAIGVAAHLTYKSSNYSTAQKLWRLQSRVTWYDQDVPHVNAGLAYYKRNQFTPAVDQLEQALTQVNPKLECKVRWNLAVALAARANELTQSQPVIAVGDYTRAIAVLSEGDCVNQAEYKEMFQQQIDTLTTKLDDLIKQINEQHTRPKDPNEKKPSDPMPDDQKKAQELQRQNQYKNSQDSQKQNSQSAEEKDKSYSETAW